MTTIAVLVGGVISAFFWINAILGIAYPETGGSSFARWFRFYVAFIVTASWIMLVFMVMRFDA